jgi:hypothetical protein
MGEREMLEVNDLGDATRLLSDPSHLGEKLDELLNRGIMPTEDGWGGWLGRYQAGLCNAAREIKHPGPVQRRDRKRDRSLGR